MHPDLRSHSVRPGLHSFLSWCVLSSAMALLHNLLCDCCFWTNLNIDFFFFVHKVAGVVSSIVYYQTLKWLQARGHELQLHLRHFFLLKLHFQIHFIVKFGGKTPTEGARAKKSQMLTYAFLWQWSDGIGKRTNGGKEGRGKLALLSLSEGIYVPHFSAETNTEATEWSWFFCSSQ